MLEDMVLGRENGLMGEITDEFWGLLWILKVVAEVRRFELGVRV